MRGPAGQKRKIAVLISGRGSNLQALIDTLGPAVADSPVEFCLVLSNRPDASGLERARQAGIPTLVVNHRDYADRAAFDQAMDREIRKAGAEIVVLAGFLRLLTADFIDGWQDRMINIHPALLPAFKGLHTHERALETGVRFHGCTVHLVRAEMDTGPIICQAVVPVLPDDTPDSLGARVLEAEHRIFPVAVSLLAQDRIRVTGEIARIEGTVDWPGDSLISPAAI